MRTGKHFASADDNTRLKCAKSVPTTANQKALMLLGFLLLVFATTVQFARMKTPPAKPLSKSSGIATGTESLRSDGMHLVGKVPVVGR